MYRLGRRLRWLRLAFFAKEVEMTAEKGPRGDAFSGGVPYASLQYEARGGVHGKRQ